MFDPVLFASQHEDPAISTARSFKAFIISALFFILMLLKVTAFYLYVDSNNVIPQQWLDSVYSTCPAFKKANLFHKAGLSHEGYLFAVPCFYFFNWYRRASYAKQGKHPTEPKVTWFESAFRVVSFLVCDHLVTDVAPKLIYGTTDIDTVPMLIKRASLMVALSWVNGPLSDWLRTKL